MRMEQAIAAIRFEPVLPLWLLAGLALLCLLAVGVALWLRARGTGWRIMAFAVLLLWLSGPRVVEETREGLPDIALLVVDESASMQVGNRAALAERARASIEAQARALPRLELRSVSVPEAGSEGTKLFAAIERGLADIPRSRLAGIIAITDGQAHDVPESPVAEAPLHVLIPAKGEEVDRRVRVVEAPGYGIVGKSVGLRVVVEDLGLANRGLATGRSARLTIRRDGEPPVTLDTPPAVEREVEIPITRGGPTVVEVAVEPLPGEVSAVNNRAVVTINGVRDRLRVLLVSGEPHPGERTWRRLLKSDPAVDLVHFTILRPPEKDDMTPLNELALIAFPVRELFQVKIKEFDLIIMDRFANRSTLPPVYLKNIADYVREGGALLMSAGPEFTSIYSLAATPLAAVLSARPAPGGNALVEEAFRPEVTPLGARHPVTENLPGWKDGAPAAWGRWYRRIEVANPRGDVVLAAPTPSGPAPLLTLEHVGEGRAALLLSDHIWLWSRGHDGGGPQGELLRRIAHWLMKEPELEETALLARIERGQLTIERRSTEDAPPPPLAITDPAGAQTRLMPAATRPGRAVATMPAAAPGVWSASDGTRTAFAASNATNPVEIADLRATATILAAQVKATGGGVQWLNDPRLAPATTFGGAPILRRTEPNREASGTGWIGLQRRHDHVVTGITASPLLPSWLALPLILGLALMAWRREGA